ncbi:hypothetical protein Patl1_01399 [Pistacia atlantica]|uniref:Uncharacterized protein n=1 Tax=Pistacia atlantica TaxID=434234 RepID=A0ACC1C7I1_9ROSI|nr:hypothetical protein Patl1_01399 [Pistacia atlantica]
MFDLWPCDINSSSEITPSSNKTAPGGSNPNSSQKTSSSSEKSTQE